MAALYVGCPFRLSLVLGDSMAPTMTSGEIVIVDQTWYSNHPLTRGDVVMFEHEGRVLTKRVYGAPGDRLRLLRYSDGTYRIPNDREVAMIPHLKRYNKHCKVIQLYVPWGTAFVVGDNRMHSEDSRQFGLVSAEAIIGKMVAPEAQ